MSAAVATTSTTANRMSRTAKDVPGATRRGVWPLWSLMNALAVLMIMMLARSAHGADAVEDPGSRLMQVENGGYSVPKIPVWLGGDLTVQGTVPQNDRAKLELDDINLLVRFEPLPRLSFFSETRLENTFTITEGQGGHLDSSDIFIERLYADWLATPHLTIRVGKFLTPFGVWNQIRRAPLTWTVERPLVTENTFPEHTTGIGLIYQATLHGWSIDGTLYGPAQDALPLRSSTEAGVTLVGGRVAAAHQIGDAYLTVGLSGGGAERRQHAGLQPMAGTDINLSFAGNDLLGEFAYARSPERFVDDEWGLYLQDSFPLFDSFYAVARYEHFRSFNTGAIDIGLLGFAWRLDTHLIVKANYQLTTKPSEDVPRGFLCSFALFF